MNAPSLAAKIVAVHDALHEIPHAFGGALALAYYAEPRATVDIDVNVFVPVEDADRVLAPLAAIGIDTAGASSSIARAGQARVTWGHTPIDLFFSYDRFHEAASRAAIEVPFGDEHLRILSAEHLTVCKVVFDRPRDWVDIEAMLTLGTAIDPAEVLRWVGRIVGDDDPRYDRIAALLTTPPTTPHPP